MKNCKQCLQPIPMMYQPFRSQDAPVEELSAEESISIKPFRSRHPRLYNSIKNVLAVCIFPAGAAIVSIIFYYVGLFCKSNGLCHGEFCNDPAILIGFTYAFIVVLGAIILAVAYILGKMFIEHHLE